jgi:hypothetical protein
VPRRRVVFARATRLDKRIGMPARPRATWLGARKGVQRNGECMGVSHWLGLSAFVKAVAGCATTFALAARGPHTGPFVHESQSESPRLLARRASLVMPIGCCCKFNSPHLCQIHFDQRFLRRTLLALWQYCTHPRTLDLAISCYDVNRVSARFGIPDRCLAGPGLACRPQGGVGCATTFAHPQCGFQPARVLFLSPAGIAVSAIPRPSFHRWAVC